MKMTAGPVTIIDTQPQGRRQGPYARWDGNQATYLFFPVFASFLLVLLSTLSDPIIEGVTVVNIGTNGTGSLALGAWGWCTRGIPNVTDDCSAHRDFGGSMSTPLETVPVQLAPLRAIGDAVPPAYLIANGIFHLFACIACWLTTIFTLAAAGFWRNQDRQAWDWTRWSFAGTAWSAGCILIPWSLDLAEIGRVQNRAINTDGSQPSVTPGAAIWMMMAAFLLNLVTFICRVTWLKYKPRPLWTIEGQGGDFHDPTPPPLSVALPPADEQPPTWESLEIRNPLHKAFDNVDEKAALSSPSPSKHGFAV